MANVAHSTLTGADLHEPKGVATATSGQVYIANGSGSGAWGSTSTLFSFIGMIADFELPIVPTGWLEYDGSAVSRTTYSDLFTARTIQGTGTRTNASAIVTGLSSTTHMRVGYYIGGTGITNGTKILTVDSAAQVTMDAAATSSGSATVIVSPWGLGNGSTTFTLGDATTVGRFRRSRTSSVPIGTSQASQNLAHTHTGTTSGGSAHTHTISITDPGHTHSNNHAAQTFDIGGSGSISGSGLGADRGYNVATIQSNTTGITATASSENSHTHTFTTASSGDTEARPVSLTVLVCVKY